MVKFELRGVNGRQVLGIGLSDENIKRLKEKNPIVFDLALFGFEETDVLIMWGSTEADIERELKSLVVQHSPNAEIVEGEEYCDCPPGAMARYPHQHNPRPQK